MNNMFNLSGERIIWQRNTKQRTYYTTTLASTVNGITTKASLEVRFPKDVYIDNGQKINIKKGFLSCYKNDNYVLLNKTTNQKLIYNQIYIAVLDYDLVGEPIVPNFATKNVD